MKLLAIVLLTVLGILALPGRAPAEEYAFHTEELCAERDGLRIYGKLYLPETDQEKLPAVIISHGFCGVHQMNEGYASLLAKNGYAAYIFDFCGGAPVNRSDGKMTDMSIFTEQKDLEAVLGMISSHPRVDPDRVTLFGQSQGGVVSAITAAEHTDEVNGLILFFPAFVLVDDAMKLFPKPEDVPDTYPFWNVTLGRAYPEKLFGYDIYEDIKAYEKPVIILHGDKDPVVPLRYSEKARDTYRNAELTVFPGAGHGFGGEDDRKACELVLKYLSER